MSKRRALLAIFSVALGIRILFAIFIGNQPELRVELETSDLAYAQEMLAGTDWITTPLSPKAPGYPATLAVMYMLSAKQQWLTLFYQSILGALTVVVLFIVAQTLLSPVLATIAALWYALSFNHLLYTGFFLRDFFAVLCLVLCMFFLARPFTRMRYALLAGLAYGLLVHVDPQYLLIGPVFCLFMFLFKSGHRLINVQYLFVFIMAFVLFSVPWTVRNTIVYGQPIPVSLESTRYLRPFKVLTVEPSQTVSGVEERVKFASRTRRVQTNAMEFWRFARFSEGESFRSTESVSAQSPEPAWSPRHNLASIASYGVLLPFLLVGTLVSIARRSRTGLILAGTLLAFFLLRTYIGGSERARLPMDPAIILLAFYGFAFLWDKIRTAPAAD